MKVGDIITAYHKGYHRLDRIERRFLTQEYVNRYGVYKVNKTGDELSPLFHYTQIADSKLNPKKGSKCCDALFCKLAKTSIDEEILSLTEQIEKLKEFKKTI